MLGNVELKVLNKRGVEQAKDIDLFVAEWVRIPQQDRIGVHGACLSQVRTFEKTKEVREAIAEADAEFGMTEELI